MALEQEALRLASPKPTSVLLLMWEGFVAECESGYSDYIDEYMNDIAPRAHLQAIAESEIARSAPDFDSFALQLNRIDERFRSLLIPISELEAAHKEWWLKGLPKYGTDYFSSDVAAFHGYNLEEPPTV